MNRGAVGIQTALFQAIFSIGVLIIEAAELVFIIGFRISIFIGSMGDVTADTVCLCNFCFIEN